MKLDSANRSFLAIVAVTVLLATYLLCGAFGTVLVPLAAARVSRQGRGLLDSSGGLVAMLGFVTVVGVGLALGARSITRQLAGCRRLARRVHELTVPMPDALAKTAAAVGLDGRVVLLDEPELLSFAYGVLTPRVAVSRGLLEGVSRGELRAVLEHERYHVENLDPLKLLLAQTLSAAFFFLPSVDSLRTRYLADRELAADRRAVNVCGRRPLASALLKVVGGPDWVELDDVAAIGGKALLDVRVAQLETGVEAKPAPFGTTRVIRSIAAAALFAASSLACMSRLGAAVSPADLLSDLLCAVAFAGVALVAYWILARRATRRVSGGS